MQGRRLVVDILVANWNVLGPPRDILFECPPSLLLNSLALGFDGIFFDRSTMIPTIKIEIVSQLLIALFDRTGEMQNHTTSIHRTPNRRPTMSTFIADHRPASIHFPIDVFPFHTSEPASRRRQRAIEVNKDPTFAGSPDPKS